MWYFYSVHFHLTFDWKAEGAQRCWEKVVGDLNVTPDEGLCLDVLHTAARHGLSDLATDVIRVLRILGADWQEHHFAPLVEALCKAGKLKDAFGTLDLMRSSNIFPTAVTARPIYDFLKQDIDKVDGAWALLDTLRSEGKTIDRTAINAIIRAAISLSDLQRAVGAYKAFPDYKCVPDIDTFNSLLSGCIVASHRELGNRLLLELKELGIKPDATTYERIIVLCLTQATYEDAFFYLEEMKAQKFVPPRSVYDAIIRTCIAAGDSRYTLALDELKQCGYTVSNSLQTFIDSGGRESKPRS
jgi:pentatricopeptide repeat protein